MPTTAIEIAAGARSVDPSKRAEYVRRACGGNAALLAEVEALLGVDAASATWRSHQIEGADAAEVKG